MAATVPTTAPSDLLRIADLTAVQLNALLDLADEMKSGPSWWAAPLHGTSVAFIFEKPFPRARVTFEGAVHRLGMLPIVLRPEELRLGRGTPLSDIARILSGRAETIVVATSTHARLEEVARAATVPVVNARTDDHRPCQALADLLTIRRQFGYLEGLRLAYVGAADNVTHSLMEAGALAGMHVAVATPPGHDPDHEVTMSALRLAAEHGGSVHVGLDPRAAVALADVVYTDAWVSRRTPDFQAYQVSEALMRAANPDAVFMHGLPAHRGYEVTSEVIDGASSIVSEQAANRLPTAQATLHTLIASHH